MPVKSRANDETIDCVCLKLETIRLVCARILYPAFVPLAVNFDFSFFPSEISKSAVEASRRSFSFVAGVPLSLVCRLNCS